MKPNSGLSPLITWSGSSGLARHFIHTLYSGASNTWLWEGKQLFNSSSTLITRMARQPPYLCTDWYRQFCSYVQASSSLYGALNVSRGKLSTLWKPCPHGTTTVVTELSRKRLIFSSLLEMCCLLSRSYSQKWIFSKVRWHSRCLPAPSIEKTDWGAYAKGNDRTVVRAPKHSQVLCKQYPDNILFEFYWCLVLYLQSESVFKISGIACVPPWLCFQPPAKLIPMFID